jgi:hypothetical protein
MKINQLVKTQQGTFTFDAELTQEQYDTIFNVGVNTLLGLGVFVTNGNTVQPKEESSIIVQ